MKRCVTEFKVTFNNLKWYNTYVWKLAIYKSTHGIKSFSIDFKVISYNEESDMSQSCKIESNNAHDTCVYKSISKLIDKRFNCSFGFLYNDSEESATENPKECKIGNEGNLWSVAALRDILKDVKFLDEHKWKDTI